MSETVEKERILPEADEFYEAIIDKVTIKEDVENEYDGKTSLQDDVVLILNLLNTAPKNDGERDFSVHNFQKITGMKQLQFEHQGSMKMNKLAKDVIKAIFGKFPSGKVVKDDVNLDALAGVYCHVMIEHKTNKQGKTFANVKVFMKPKDKSHQEFNELRYPVIFQPLVDRGGSI